MEILFGVQGPQGPKGQIGPLGPRGLTGPAGKSGNGGPTGATGPAGIVGSTGIQLYGNASLIQCASLRNSNIPVESNAVGYYIPFAFNTFTPALSGNRSTTITGQYDTSGLNYYGVPLTVSGEYITVPSGKYLISSVLPIGKDLSLSEFFLELSLYTGEGWSTIVRGTPAGAACASHLQHYYTSSQDTIVGFRLFTTPNVTMGVFQDVSTGYPNASLSIVKIW